MGKILTSYTSDRGLLSRIYKENFKNETSRKQPSHLKMGHGLKHLSKDEIQTTEKCLLLCNRFLTKLSKTCTGGRTGSSVAAGKPEILWRLKGDPFLILYKSKLKIVQRLNVRHKTLKLLEKKSLRKCHETLVKEIILLITPEKHRKQKQKRQIGLHPSKKLLTTKAETVYNTWEDI